MPSIVTAAVSVAVCETAPQIRFPRSDIARLTNLFIIIIIIKEWCDLENRVTVRSRSLENGTI